jgi:hypothetical protein
MSRVAGARPASQLCLARPSALAAPPLPWCCAHNLSLQPKLPIFKSWATPDPPHVLLLRFRLGTGCILTVGAGGRRSERRPRALGAPPLPWPSNPPLVQRLRSTWHRLYASWVRVGDVRGVVAWREYIRSSWLLLLAALLQNCMQHQVCSACAAPTCMFLQCVSVSQCVLQKADVQCSIGLCRMLTCLDARCCSLGCWLVCCCLVGCCPQHATCLSEEGC